jgi:chemotaxis signal transduction protein
VLFVAAGWLLIWKADSPLASAMGGTLIAGAALYIAGVILWRGRTAYVVRFVGWLLVTAPLAVPSTLTLALPLAALLVVSLTEVESVRPRSGLIARHS